MKWIQTTSTELQWTHPGYSGSSQTRPFAFDTQSFSWLRTVQTLLNWGHKIDIYLLGEKMVKQIPQLKHPVCTYIPNLSKKVCMYVCMYEWMNEWICVYIYIYIIYVYIQYVRVNACNCSCCHSLSTASAIAAQHRSDAWISEVSGSTTMAALP